MREEVARRMAFQAAQGNTVVGGTNKADRYDKIENWIVSKRICEHDELCEKVCQMRLKDTKPRLRKQTMSTVDSIESEEDEEIGVDSERKSSSDDGSTSNATECPICFNTFEMSDVVSWSVDPSCSHIFHHRCIKEWLLKNKGCPFCREIFLPVDRMGSNLNFANLSELMVSQESRSLRCWYCVDHGIVSLPEKIEEHLDEKDCASILHRAQDIPDRSVLSEMRGPVQCIQCDLETGIDQDVAIDSEELASDDGILAIVDEESQAQSDADTLPDTEE